ncbi:O-antigen ligase family protein [Paramagnetospirillum magneticum]|uniref:Uncharacterized protein n=1 Tax=Paramagnetospirillum magneticum (strain ATCC 700264 / AMB-1) TaxID=342108 RepID=Q2W8D4_PARM1|nr:hypothetical protein [Paramagnetospirillum magneticum]BAE49891.1 hypothetical protein amb1087 [Paramagnetospirillum magneticum AMB-1]
MRSDLNSGLRPVLGPALALLLALPIALGSLPPFRFGYWDKAEPMVVWLNLCSFLGALALARCAWVMPRATVPNLFHPYVLAPLAVALWSLAAAPFDALPRLSLFGVPQSGLGALWFLDFAILIACGLMVRDCRVAWRLLCWAAAAITLVIAGLKVSDHFFTSIESTLLLYVDAYYGWIGVTLPVLAWWWTRHRRDWPLTVTLAIAALACVYSSHSLTAWSILIGGTALVLASERLPVQPVRLFTRSPWGSAVLVAVGALLPPFALRAAKPLLNSPSLLDRLHLQEMVLADMARSPSWLMGQGWGRVQDAFHGNLNVTGENLWQPTWIFLSSDYFSSHNWLLDTVHAVGLPGAGLVLAGFLVLPLYAAPAARPAATMLALAYALISAVWFHLCFSLPFFALAMAAVGRSAREVEISALQRRAAAWSLMAVAALPMLGAGALAEYGLNIGAIHRGLTGGAVFDRAWPVDPRGSDLEAAEVIRDAFADLAKDERRPNPAAIPGARAMMATLAARIPQSDTVQMITIGLGVQSYLHFSKELAWLAPDLPSSRDLWRPWLDRLLWLAPGRTDQAIGYLTDRAVAGDLLAVEQVVTAILKRNPSDPVGLYFRGLALILLRDPTVRPLAVDSFRASVAAGIERFMPLDPVVRQLIESR